MRERKVQLLHAGGTLGMIGNPLEPGDYAERLFERVPELGKIAELRTRIVCNRDSTDLGPEQWADLAVAVTECGDADGVVIVHGTDTMAYTAAALAFALEGLDRPVVLTGAQLPLASLRTDARRNLQDAVTIATLPIPEVAICFDGLLLRGCRAVKSDSAIYRAFASPGVPPLATMGTGVDVASHVRAPGRGLGCDPRFDPRVAVLYVAPGLAPDVIDRMIEGGEVRGLVLAALGVGNVPTVERALGPAIRRAVDAGVEVIAVTQWGGAVDLGAYKTGLALRDAGVIPGGRMRIEAAVPKLMAALARFEDRSARRAWLEQDVAGERH